MGQSNYRSRWQPRFPHVRGAAAAGNANPNNIKAFDRVLPAVQLHLAPVFASSFSLQASFKSMAAYGRRVRGPLSFSVFRDGDGEPGDRHEEVQSACQRQENLTGQLRSHPFRSRPPAEAPARRGTSLRTPTQARRPPINTIHPLPFCTQHLHFFNFLRRSRQASPHRCSPSALRSQRARAFRSVASLIPRNCPLVASTTVKSTWPDSRAQLPFSVAARPLKVRKHQQACWVSPVLGFRAR